MPPQDTVHWIGPTSEVLRTASQFRLWRWTDADDALLSISRPRRGDNALDRLRRAPGYLEPGYALIGPAGHPLCALGRHPRWLTEQSHEEALLAPTQDGRWSQQGVARTERVGTTLVDAAGTVRSQLTRNPNWRSEPLDAKDRLAVGGHTLRLDPVLVGGMKGFWSFLSPPECVGVRWVDEACGAVVVEASTEGLPGWRGDVTHPVLVRWSVEPDPWSRAAMLLLLGAMIDLSDGVHTD